MPLGLNMEPPRGHMFYVGLHRENIKKSSYHKLRALIFGMLHHQVGLYQVCSNYAPRAKNGRMQGAPCIAKASIGKHEKKTSCLVQTMALEPPNLYLD